MLVGSAGIWEFFQKLDIKRKLFDLSKRTQRVQELIKREVSKIFLKEIEFPEGILATVTRVQVSPDLNYAKVYISIIPDRYLSQSIKSLNGKLPFIQKKLNRTLVMRNVPKIVLTGEKAIKEADRIEELLEGVKNGLKK